MGTTPALGLRFPALADIPNIPSDIQNLANDVETELARRGIVGRIQRATQHVGEDVGADRIMSTTAQVRSGRTYKVSAHLEVYAPIVPNTAQAELYVSTTGEPTLDSTQLNRAVTHLAVVDVPETLTVSGLYHATASGTLRAMLAVQVFGSGSGSFHAGGDSGYPAELWIEDVGPTRLVTGSSSFSDT